VAASAFDDDGARAMAETTARSALMGASLVHSKMNSQVRRTVLPIIAGLCCLVATVLSYNLLLKHVAGSSGQAWFEAGCSEETGPGRANCDAVLATPYSYFPPKHAHEYSERRHIPVAFLGMLYYSTLMVWIIGVGPPSRERRWAHLVPLAMVEFGVPASLYYTFIMFRVLDEWCPWCLVTHVLNVLIAVCIALMWPRTAESAGVAAGGEGEGQLSHRPPRPSARAVLLTVGVTAVVAYANLNAFELKTWQQKADGFHSDYEACRSVVRRIKRDTDKLIAMWQGARPCEISMRPDDPVRLRAASSDDQPPMRMVVFSDFECPSCARFAKLLDRTIEPFFDGHLKITYKHYPLDRTCDKRIRRTSHPHACAAARMVEAARLLKGNKGFWAAHDYLYKSRNDVEQGKMTPERFAGALGLDVEAVVGAMEGEPVGRRIAEDVTQGKTCGMQGTPTVFIEGKPVEPLALMEVAFWDKVADLYWQGLNIPRPASAKLPSISRAP
jgi:protein-disulfide isomerase/uncharacterized membrane protein